MKIKIDLYFDSFHMWKERGNFVKTDFPNFENFCRSKKITLKFCLSTKVHLLWLKKMLEDSLPIFKIFTDHGSWKLPEN